MKERPILFSGEMVRAILEGRKTVTRRVAKLPVESDTASINPDGVGGWVLWAPNPVSDEVSRRMYPDGGGFKCPYGQPGDRLWVRETWHLWGPPEREVVDYRATCPDADDLKWRPSIFMPRSASRIALEVTGVRVERVKDISEADAKAEGVWTDSADMRMLSSATKNHIGAFSRLWDEINAKRGYSWESNPWVWCVEFKQVDNA